MANYVSGMNPTILRWAREQSGYSASDVAKKLNKETKIIENWETGISTPTYSQLEYLSYTLYKRPIALFFFPEPPKEQDLNQSFRTLPEHEIESLSSDAKYALRQAKAMQIALMELTDGINPSKHKIFRDIQFNIKDDVILTSTHVRKYLGITLDEQKSWKDSDDALKSWRTLIEGKGIFVFKRSFKQEEVSGFCLKDNEFPIIYLNNSTPKTRQVFTLFHELAHILLNTNGITKIDDSYINTLSGENKSIEIYCNRFAGEFLVPNEDFSHQLNIDTWNDESIGKLANDYYVSCQVILRKLLDRSLVDPMFFDTKMKKWNEEYEKNRLNRSGGNYYNTQTTYLGNNFLSLAFGKYYQGQCTIEQLADYLDIKVKSIAGLEQKLLKDKSLAT